MIKFSCIVVILLSLFFNGNSVHSLTCRDDEGKAVDWFIVYKIPLLQNDPSKQLSSGYSYAFVAGPSLRKKKSILSVFSRSSAGQDAWKLSDKLVTDGSSIFGQTISPLYDSSAKYSFVMYNDQPPTSSGELFSLCIAYFCFLRSLKKFSALSLVALRHFLLVTVM